MAKSLRTLLNHLPEGDLLALHGDSVPISAPVVETASEVQPGGLFVARQGASFDGHDYIPEAIERGAAAVVGEHELLELSVPYAQVRDARSVLGLLAAAYHDFPSRKLVVVGVTGTNGKTTTVTLIHRILNTATDGQTGYVSTLAADLGGSTANTGLHVTTPGAPQVQAYLAQMVANGLSHCVLEITSHGLAQDRMKGVDIDVAVLTNLTHEHLDYHGTFEAYRTTKATMFEMLANSHRKPETPKLSVINADDPNAEFFAAIPADRIIRFGIVSGANISVERITHEPDQTTLDVSFEDSVHETFHTPLAGNFNVSNVLAALSVGYGLGCNIDALHAISKVASIPGRMERIDEGQDFVALVDFAHTPDALEKVLQTTRMMLEPSGRLIAVFGSAGLRDVEKRRLMAEISAKLADFTILTAEDPRTESLDEILQMMAEGCRSQGGIEGETFIRIPDRGEALYQACQMARVGDIVIACGKGHEQSMCFGTTEYPWDDREALRTALRGAPLRTLPTAAS